MLEKHAHINLPYKFYHRKENKVYSEIWDLLDDEVKSLNLSNIIHNETVDPFFSENYLPYTNNLSIIKPWTFYKENENKLSLNQHVSEERNIGLSDFLSICERYYSSLGDKRIGVHLSGGFDSSLVIGLLNYFKVPFWLIGLNNKRYEFRTESHIQNILADKGVKTVFIDHEECLPFSDLEKIPLNQFPDAAILSYKSSLKIAQECAKLNLDFVFTGSGGDFIFTDAVPLNPKENLWNPIFFNTSLHGTLIYKPLGIELVSFYGVPEILDAFYNLRKGQKVDFKKAWGRLFFKDYLPRELSAFTYSADFFGLYIDGILNAMETIENLFESAYEITRNEAFSKKAFKQFKAQDFLVAEKKLYTSNEPLIATAAWLNSLKQNMVI